MATVDLQMGRIHYEEAGPADGRPVVCVSGEPDSGYAIRHAGRAETGHSDSLACQGGSSPGRRVSRGHFHRDHCAGPDFHPVGQRQLTLQ